MNVLSFSLISYEIQKTGCPPGSDDANEKVNEDKENDRP